MRRSLAFLPGLLLLIGATGLAADAAGDALGRGLAAIHSMTGCYLVDYSYVEVESLKPGYTRDARVYDVNRDKSAKEWISVDVVSPRRVRLQRVLFLVDLAGAVRAGTAIRHQTEDWEYDAPFLYELVAPGSDAGPVDAARDQPRRWAPLSVRGPLGGGHRLPGVVVLDLRARSRP
jgi:hypothetical protein